jgi:hypothetical protein
LRKDWQAPLAFELHAQPATLRVQCTTQPATTVFQSAQDRADLAARSDPLMPERSDLRPKHPHSAISSSYQSHLQSSFAILTGRIGPEAKGKRQATREQ